MLEGISYHGIRETKHTDWSGELNEDYYEAGQVFQKTFPAGTVSLRGNNGGDGSFVMFVAHPGDAPTPPTDPGMPGHDTYIGCFTDNSDRDLGAMVGVWTNSATNTYELCRAECLSRGNVYMSLQWGGECFCADEYATADAYYQVDDSNCNVVREPCSPNSHNCGGTWHQAIYQIAEPAGLWGRHYPNGDTGLVKCNNNVDMVYVTDQMACQMRAVANGHQFYSFRHNGESAGHKCMSSATCDDHLDDRTNDWYIYSSMHVLNNGDFEEGFTTDSANNGHMMSSSGYEYTRTFPGWTATGGTVMVASGNGPWGGPVASSGGYLLALQGSSAEISQTITNMIVGRSYTLTMGAAQRTNSPGGSNAILRVSANGQELLNKHVTATINMETQTMTFTADSTTVQLQIQNVVAGGDQTVFVDNIALD